jgi:DNA-binding transcriptional LysR family regulator
VPIANEILTVACAAAGYTPRIHLRVGEWTAKLGFAAAGLGITLVPSLLAPGVRPDLVLRPLTDPAPRRMLTLTRPPPTRQAPATRAFLDLLYAVVTQNERLTTPSRQLAASSRDVDDAEDRRSMN